MNEIKRQYFESGQIYCEVPYQNNQVHGIVKEWHENGQLYRETSYQNNQLHGITKRWSASGQINSEKYYLYGVKVSPEEYRKHELIEKLSCLK